MKFYNYSTQEKASDPTNALQLQTDTVVQRERFANYSNTYLGVVFWSQGVTNDHLKGVRKAAQSL